MDQLRHKRALAGLGGGPIERSGDPATAELLARAFDVVSDGMQGPLTHGFHSYPARFHPELVRRLLALSPDARRVLDPFAGSGTTLVEAVLAGRQAFGVDANPLAVWLARLKATPTTREQRDRLARAAQAVVERTIDEVKGSRRRSTERGPASSATRFDLPRLYPPHVFRELVTLRLAIDSVLDEESGRGDGAVGDEWLRTALLLVLSSNVIKLSLQRSDTDTAIVVRQIARGYATRLYGNRAIELSARLEAFAQKVPPGTPPPSVNVGDARALQGIASGSIDLVITSPPYLGTYDYSAHHERRFGWLGLDAGKLRASEIGARRSAADPARATAQWGKDVGRYVAEIARVLDYRRTAYLVVGDSVIGGRSVPGEEALRRAATAAGLTVVAMASQARPDVYMGAEGEGAEGAGVTGAAAPVGAVANVVAGSAPEHPPGAGADESLRSPGEREGRREHLVALRKA